MEETTKILQIDVKTNADDAREKLLKLKKELQENADAIKAVQEEMKEEGADTDALNRKLIDLQAQRKALTAEAKKQEKQIVADIAANRQEVGSLDQLRNALASLTKQYDALSQEERESAKGTDLKDKINDITATLKAAEGDTQRFQRNVGNYPSAFDAGSEAIGRFGDILAKVFGANSPMAQAVKGFADFTKKAKDFDAEADNSNEVFQGMANGMNNASQATAGATRTAGTATVATKGLTTAAKALGKQLLALLANPIVLTIAAIVAAVAALVAIVKKVTDAIKASDDAGTALEELMQVLKVPLRLVTQLFEMLGHALTPVIEGITKLVSGIYSLIPALKKQADAEREVVRMVDAYEEAQRRSNRAIAEAERDSAELMTKSRDREKYNLQERTEFLDEALKKEKLIAKERKALADRDLQQRIAEVARDKGISRQRLTQAVKAGEDLGNLTDDIKNDLAQLYTATVNAETQYNQDIRRLTSQRSTFIEEEKRERVAAAKKAIEDRKAAAKKEIEILRQIEDATIAAITEQAERERVTLTVAAQRKIADIRERLHNEQDLTTKAREGLAQRIKQIEQKLQKDLSDLAKKTSEERIKREVETAQRVAQARLEMATKGAQEYADAVAAVERLAYKRESEELQNQLEEEKLTFDQFYELDLAAKKKHQKAIKDAEDSIRQQQIDDIRLDWENRINAELDGSREQLRLRLQAAKEERDAMQRFNSETDAQYLSRQLAQNEKIKKAQDDLANYDKATAAARIESVNAIGGAVGALSQLMSTTSEENRALAIASKATALGEVAINTGVAIAKGVKAASDVPFPGNIASIATTVATVLANIATAISTINSAQFARGGFVQGSGTATSDSIPARLSNGESVMTAAATAAHYDTLSRWNVEGGGVPFPQSSARRYARGGVVAASGAGDVAAIAAAVAKMQPVVSVREITKAQNKVKVKENQLNRTR